MAQSATASHDSETVSGTDDEAMTGPFPVPETYHERGPVATIIYIALRAGDRPLGVREIAEVGGRPENTIRHHTRELVSSGLIERRPDCSDSRCNIYSLPE